jgi:hypothetical protein
MQQRKGMTMNSYLKQNRWLVAMCAVVALVLGTVLGSLVPPVATPAVAAAPADTLVFGTRAACAAQMRQEFAFRTKNASPSDEIVSSYGGAVLRRVVFAPGSEMVVVDVPHAPVGTTSTVQAYDRWAFGRSASEIFWCDASTHALRRTPAPTGTSDALPADRDLDDPSDLFPDCNEDNTTYCNYLGYLIPSLVGLIPICPYPGWFETPAIICDLLQLMYRLLYPDGPPWECPTYLPCELALNSCVTQAWVCQVLFRLDDLCIEGLNQCRRDPDPDPTHGPTATRGTPPATATVNVVTPMPTDPPVPTPIPTQYEPGGNTYEGGLIADGTPVTGIAGILRCLWSSYCHFEKEPQGQPPKDPNDSIKLHIQLESTQGWYIKTGRMVRRSDPNDPPNLPVLYTRFVETNLPGASQNLMTFGGSPVKDLEKYHLQHKNQGQCGGESMTCQAPCIEASYVRISAGPGAGTVYPLWCGSVPEGATWSETTAGVTVELSGPPAGGGTELGDFHVVMTELQTHTPLMGWKNWDGNREYQDPIIPLLTRKYSGHQADVTDHSIP